MPDPHGPGSQSNTEAARDVLHAKAKNGDRRPVESAAFDAPAARTFGDELRADRLAVFAAPDIWRDTFRPLAAIQSEMARWFDDLWREAANGRGVLAGYDKAPATALAPMSVFAGLPRADMKETDADYRLHVELPGLKPKDVDVEIEGDTLVVRGLKSDGRTGEAVNYHITERRFGRVERRFALPVDVDPGKVKADFADGVLNVVLPKDASVRHRRRIEVHAG